MIAMSNREQIDLREVEKLLANAASHYSRMLRNNSVATRYLAHRGIGGGAAERYGLGYAGEGWHGLAETLRPFSSAIREASGLQAVRCAGAQSRCFDRFRNRVMFPIRDAHGVVVGFGGRAIDGHEAKYINTTEGPLFRKRELLYGLYEGADEIRKRGMAVVVEGYLDVVSLAQAGMGCAVATMGTACTAAQLEKLFALTSKVVFCFDGDSGGRRAAERAAQVASQFAHAGTDIAFAFLPSGDDPDSFVRAHGAAAFQSLIDGAMTLDVFLLSIVTADCDLRYAEGRAKCLYRAGPLWGAMPAGSTRYALLAFCSRLISVEPVELLRLWEGEDASS